MKKFIILGMILSVITAAYATVPNVKTTEPPQGTFKKLRNGNYASYDKNGKRTGVYKISGRKLVRIK